MQNENGAELMLIWVSASVDTCYERMKKRNSARDVHKLNNWENYVKKIDFTPPYELEENNAVDKVIIFDTNNDEIIKKSLNETLKILKESNND